MNLDATDLKILRRLQSDGRLSNQELADQVALSPSACHRRVKRLEDEGFIDGYQAILNARKLGFGIEALVELNIAQISEEQHNYVLQELTRMPEIVHAYIVTGDANYVLYVRARNFEAFSRFVIDRLNKLKGVTRIQSQIVLKNLKPDARGLPV